MSFVEGGGVIPPQDPPADFFAPRSPNEEPVKMTLTASRQAVERMILLLHNRNIISGSEWSRPIVIKNTPQVISVAVRMIATN